MPRGSRAPELDAPRPLDGDNRSYMVHCGRRGWKATPDFLAGYEVNLRAALEAAGVEFIAENYGEAGARLRKATGE